MTKCHGDPICFRAALKKDPPEILKIFEVPKCHVDPLCHRADRKNRKNIYKYLRCVNAPGSSMSPCGPKKILKNIFKYLRCLNALEIP